MNFSQLRPNSNGLIRSCRNEVPKWNGGYNREKTKSLNLSS